MKFAHWSLFVMVAGIRSNMKRRQIMIGLVNIEESNETVLGPRPYSTSIEVPQAGCVYGTYKSQHLQHYGAIRAFTEHLYGSTDY